MAPGRTAPEIKPFIAYVLQRKQVAHQQVTEIRILLAKALPFPWLKVMRGIFWLSNWAKIWFGFLFKKQHVSAVETMPVATSRVIAFSEGGPKRTTQTS